MPHAFLHPREVARDGTWVRSVQITDDGDEDRFLVKVGEITENGVRLEDDKTVARTVVGGLESRGWKVIPNHLVTKFAQVTPEEVAVMSGIFTIERI